MTLTIGEEVLYCDGGKRRKRYKVIAIPNSQCVVLESCDGASMIVSLKEVDVVAEPAPAVGHKKRRRGGSIHVIYVPQGGQP